MRAYRRKRGVKDGGGGIVHGVCHNPQRRLSRVALGHRLALHGTRRHALLGGARHREHAALHHRRGRHIEVKRLGVVAIDDGGRGVNLHVGTLAQIASGAIVGAVAIHMVLVVGGAVLAHNRQAVEEHVLVVVNRRQTPCGTHIHALQTRTILKHAAHVGHSSRVERRQVERGQFRAFAKQPRHVGDALGAQIFQACD